LLRRTRLLFHTAVLGAALLVALPAAAQEESAARTTALGVGSALCTLVYTPAKLLYAGGGVLVTGLAYAFSAGDRDVIDPIVRASLYGDYVVTPDHLRGEKPLRFTGL